jgi:hypothetical protein
MIKSYSTTMVGSIPQKTVEGAMELLDQHTLSIPCWPQLPKRSFLEAMIPQYSENFPGIKVDKEAKRIWLQRNGSLVDEMTVFFEKVVAEEVAYFDVSEDYASGLHAFISRLEQEDRKFPLIKGQVTGPFTFGLGINDSDGRAIWFDEQYRDIILNGLKMKAIWQVRELSKLAEKVIIFLDEPILSALGTPAYMGIEDEDVIMSLNQIINAVQERGALAGVHCCGNMDWGLLARTDLSIINFDAYFYGEKVALYPEEIGSFLDRGGFLAWGIVPTGDAKKLHKENVDSLKGKLDELITLFVNKGLPENELRRRIILTPSCGMGSGTLTEDESELVLELLAGLAEKMG